VLIFLVLEEESQGFKYLEMDFPAKEAKAKF
jgi:hypothetical protein